MCLSIVLETLSGPDPVWEEFSKTAVASVHVAASIRSHTNQVERSNQRRLDSGEGLMR